MTGKGAGWVPSRESRETRGRDYDALGRVTTVIDPLDHSTTYTYADVGCESCGGALGTDRRAMS